MYKDRADMWEQIKIYGKEYAPKGAYKESMKDMKKNIYRDVYNKLLSNPLSLQGIRRVASMK